MDYHKEYASGMYRWRFLKSKAINALVKSPGGGGGGILPEKLSRGVRPASQNPYPIYDQNG